MRSEERRALVLLGISAILAAFLATMYALIWAGTKNSNNFFFNFPCSSVPHLTVYDVPLLNGLITVWFLYAILIFFYFSPDWFRGKGGTNLRDFFHYAATVVMGFYVIYILWYIPVVYVLIVWVPNWAQFLYVLAVVAFFIYFEVKFVEFAVNDRGLFTRYALRAYSALKPPFMRAAEKLWIRCRGRIPQQVRERLVRLRGSVHRLVALWRTRQKFKPSRRLVRILFITSLIVLYTIFTAYWNYCGVGIFR
jgi:hypothetical protein